MSAGRYEVLHYRGDRTGEDGAQSGRLLGCDEFGRPYEVIDAEYNPDTRRTTVQLQYATPENIRAAKDAS